MATDCRTRTYCLQRLRKRVTGYFLLLAVPIAASADCGDWVAKFVSTEGTVEIRRTEDAPWTSAAGHSLICAGTIVRVGDYGRAAVLLRDDTLVRLDARTALAFPSAELPSTLLDFFKGAVHFISRTSRGLKVQTPFVNAAVEGTEFHIQSDDTGTEITVFEGRVHAANRMGELVLRNGERARAGAGHAPVFEIPIKPRDAVQWALYYPPILSFAGFEFATLDAASWQGRAARSFALFRAGQRAQAYAQLAPITEDVPDASFYVYRASLSLAAGQVVSAHADIRRAQILSPDHADALALSAIIAIVQNERETGLAIAQQAVAIAPGAAGPNLALSYALQAGFRLEQARSTLARAVELAPGDALLWSRLAELNLMFRDLAGARAAAQRATALAPAMTHSQTILGFAQLLSMDPREAGITFNNAIALDSSAPLPHLGLGLALIRQGDLAQGRRELEIGAILNPSDALVRSYLGKAYFEEHRNRVAADQYEMAKHLDPLDPTPWYYAAILAQTDNQPVAALGDLQRAVALNDNRAVYRSRQLLDNDLAARSASISGIYEYLGFDQLVFDESSRSLDTDPQNFSAHRLLADSYTHRQRAETGRVSEIFQAQLMRPSSVNPIPLEVSEAKLNLPISAQLAAFNEFTPLFEQNGKHFFGNALLGSHDTVSSQKVLTGLHNKTSYSAGHYRYATNGFRENNELRHTLYNASIQNSFSDQLDLQFEYRHRETQEGDLRLNFDADNYSRLLDRQLEQNTPRIGLRYSPAPHSTFLLSFQYSDRTESLINAGPMSSVQPAEVPALGLTGPARLDTLSKTKDQRHGFDIQAQYLVRARHLNIQTGLAAYAFDGDRVNRIDLDDRYDAALADPAFKLRSRTDEDRSGEWYDANVYLTGFPHNGIVWTGGLSAVSFKDGHDSVVAFDRLLPKLAARWEVSSRFNLRAAYTTSVKRSVIFEQTLEPTQIAGFSQFLDDFNGTVAEQYGVGIDVRHSDKLFTGIELSRRHLDVPRVFEKIDFINRAVSREANVTSIFKFEPQQEDISRAYLYWTPSSNWALNASWEFTHFQRNPAEHTFDGRPKSTAQSEISKTLLTSAVPVSLRYFGPSRTFSGVKATWVTQKLGDIPDPSINDFERSTFTLLDVNLGFRFAKRRGMVSVEAKNVLDRSFNYQDTNIQTPDPSEPLFSPDRTVLGQISFNL